ncbi:WD40-repeat-containing domain protein [Chytridium lagenaria]|nr:WD40-repeat-containing domain protein [Chytridium lagenaria]
MRREEILNVQGRPSSLFRMSTHTIYLTNFCKKKKKVSMLYSPYRALGYITSSVPVALTTLAPNYYCTSAIGRSFQVYDLSTIKLVINGQAPDEIKAVAADGETTYIACSTGIFVYKRGKQIQSSSFPSPCTCVSLIVIGKLLVCLADNMIYIWDAVELESVDNIVLSDSSFVFDRLLHPNAYLNKVLVGSQDGLLQLWNIHSKKMLFQFPSFDSPITALENTLALDVISVGCADGSIYFLNIRTATILQSFLQQGRVTGLAFAMNSNKEHLLVSSSSEGCIFLWNIDQQKLIYKVENGHAGPISTCIALTGQSVILTAGQDNCIKLWVIDESFSSLRLWKSREGHYKPPSRVRFTDDGLCVLTSSSDTTFRCLSLVNDSRTFAFSSGQISKAHFQNDGEPAMAPIVSFDSNAAKENTWDTILTCHSNDSCARTWSMKKKRVGKHVLFTSDKSFAKVSLISHCGNFGFVGTSSGKIDMFNLQSGLHRKTFSGHSKPVVGLASTIDNIKLISASLEPSLKFWDMSSGALLSTLKLSSPVSCMTYHRASDVVAVACDDLGIRIVDCENFTIIREFWGHRNRILDMTFTPDSRWLVSTSTDSSMRTWDLPLGSCIDSRKLSHIATSVSFSPTGNFMATTHVNHLGVYLWSNRSLFADVSSVRDNRTIDIDSLFESNAEENGNFTVEAEDDDVLDSFADLTVTPEENDLLLLASADLNRFHALLDKEASQKRNKPKEPPKAPVAAPFFLYNSTSIFEEEKPKSRQIKASFSGKSTFQNALMQQDPELLKIMADYSPAKLELELRLLDGDQLKILLKSLLQYLKTNKDYDLVQAYLHLLLKFHGEALLDTLKNPDELAIVKQLDWTLSDSWDKVEDMYHTILAGLEFLRT